MKALIAAGGRATRLRPITHTINKHLIPLANKPMIFYAIEKLAEAGVTDIVISMNTGETELPKFIGDGSRWGVRVTYVEQKGGALGVAHVIKNAAEHFKNERFIFYLGDNIVLGSLRPLVEKFENESLDACFAFAKVKDPRQFGVPEIRDGKLIRIVEKPEHPPTQFAQTGIYLYSPRILEAFAELKPSARGELEVADANTYMIEKGHKVGWVETSGWWKDTGKPEDLLEANQLILHGMEESLIEVEPHSDAIIQGKVKIGVGTVIGSNVLIRGPVVIGANCVIENSYIGPYTSIGNEVQIRNTEIEHSVLFDSVEIDCGTRIVDSLIGLHARIASNDRSWPHGHKLIVGDHTVVEL